VIAMVVVQHFFTVTFVEAIALFEGFVRTYFTRILTLLLPHEFGITHDIMLN
jgi:hypothetical protein